MAGNIQSRPLLVGILFFFIFIFELTSIISASPRKMHKLSRISVWGRIFDNFHAVQPGLLYRSRQLSYRKFAYYIKKFQIKTVINLRGKNKSTRWWQQEKMCTKKFGLQFFNIASNASRPSTKHEICQLLALYDHAPKPILIHCYSGSDRTGEAAAIWVIDRQQPQNKKLALKQLSWKYGHIQSRRPDKAQLIKMWQGREWLIDHYHSFLFTKN